MPLQQNQNSIPTHDSMPTHDSTQGIEIYVCLSPCCFQAETYNLLLLAGINEEYEWQ